VACMRQFLARRLCVWAPLGLPLLPGEEAATPPAGAAGEM
jgi:hypothetical protein